MNVMIYDVGSKFNIEINYISHHHQILFMKHPIQGEALSIFIESSDIILFTYRYILHK